MVGPAAVGGFVAAIALIAAERLHRTVVAPAVPSLAVLPGLVDQEQAIAAVDRAAPGLLAGMMGLV